VEALGPSPSSSESFTDVSTLSSKVDKFGQPTVHTIDEDTSQEDQEGLQERDLESDQEGPQGMNDTDGILEFGNAEQALLNTAQFLVRLSAKVDNRTMLCSYNRAACASL
jgi:hypothetical protein